jgi:poly [ADP-ribose] polymerase 16
LFSPTGMGWKESQIGETFSCVAMCEYLDNPQFAKTHIKAGRSQIPEKYILVTNNDVVIVRYLLIYSNKVKIRKRNNYQNRLIDWLWNNKLLALVLCYMAILVFISMNNSNLLYHVRKYFFKK